VYRSFICLPFLPNVNDVPFRPWHTSHPKNGANTPRSTTQVYNKPKQKTKMNRRTTFEISGEATTTSYHRRGWIVQCCSLKISKIIMVVPSKLFFVNSERWNIIRSSSDFFLTISFINIIIILSF
jgi:hypothetical protein